MSAITSSGSSSSTMYQCTRADRPASTIAGKSSTPDPAGASWIAAPAGPVLHVQHPHAVTRSIDGRDGLAAADRDPVHVDLELDLGRQLRQQHVERRRALERCELEVVVVVAEPQAVVRERPGQAPQLRGEPADGLDRRAIRLGHRGNHHPRAAQDPQPLCDGPRIGPQAVHSLVRGDGREPRVVEVPGEVVGRHVVQSGQLDRPVARLGDRGEGSRQIRGEQPADRVELEGDLVVTHAETVRHPRCEMGPRPHAGIP